MGRPNEQALYGRPLKVREKLKRQCMLFAAREDPKALGSERCYYLYHTCFALVYPGRRKCIGGFILDLSDLMGVE